MHVNPVVFGAELMAETDLVEFMSPKTFFDRWDKIVAMHNCEFFSHDKDIDYDEDELPIWLDEEARIKTSVLSHINFWFSVIEEFYDKEYVVIHGFAISLIRGYIEVLYAIDQYYFDEMSDENQNDPDDQLQEQVFRFVSFDKYVEIFFPGASQAIDGNVCIRSGDMWYVRYNNFFQMMKNYKGMETIELLLDNPYNKLQFAVIFGQLSPGVSVDCSPGGNTLENCPDSTAEDIHKFNEIARKVLSKDESINNSGIKPPKKDVGLRLWKINKKIKKLQVEYGNATPDNKISIGLELKGLYDSAAKLESEIMEEAQYKKAKDSVCKNISDAMEYIKKSMPSLHFHLKESLENVSHYCPKKETTWHTRYTDKTIRAQISGRKVLFEEF